MSFLRDLFLPHSGNNHKAHLLRSYSLFLLSFVFVFLQVFLNFFALARPSVLGFSSNITPQEVIELTNSERIKSNLGVLKENKVLSEAARQKAADMFAFNYWSHISPSGRSPWSFFTDAGYKYQYAGENLARDFQDTESVVRAWMNSPSHKENIVNQKYQETGVAVVQGTLQGTQTTLVVQLFGTPYGAALKPVSNQNTNKTLQLNKEESSVQQPKIATKEVLAKQSINFSPIASPLDLTKSIVIFMAGILIGVFMVDFFLSSRRQTNRFSSRSLTQMIFLIFVLAVSLFIKQGAIL